MNIKTKFNMSDRAYYFDKQNIKLVETTIIGVIAKLLDNGDSEIEYRLDLISYCDELSCELLDGLRVWFKGINPEGHENIVVPEKQLFRTKEEFLDFVTGDDVAKAAWEAVIAKQEAHDKAVEAEKLKYAIQKEKLESMKARELELRKISDKIKL